jgi:hypothetical protein
MAFMGNAVTKLLATVSAFMTVTVGVPRFECVCPDGAVKLFCSARSEVGCCSRPSSTDSSESKRPCCREGDTSPTCCLQQHLSSSTSAGGPQFLRACGCHRTVAIDSLHYTVKDSGDGAELTTVGLVAAEMLPVCKGESGQAYLAERQFLVPTPDLTILLRHFTC